jgi:hypothetical protein
MGPIMRNVLFLAILCVSVKAVCAQQADLSKLSNAELIAKLVSKNKEPPKVNFGKSDPQEPAGYSRTAQDEIYPVINELLRRDESCLDELIGAYNDQRYSITEDYYGDGLMHCHVGQVCYTIFLRKLEPKLIVSRNPDLPTYFRTVVDHDQEAMQKWLKDRQGNSLADLQIETCTWFLKQQQPENVSDESWKRVTEGVQSQLAELKSTGKAHQPKIYKPRKRW